MVMAMNVWKRVRAIEAAADATFAERETETRLILIGLLSGQNVFLLGEPGTGKSALVRWLADHLGLTTFRVGLSAQSPKDALIGPPDVKALTEHGRYVHRVEGMMPDRQLAILDEIGLAPPDTLEAVAGLLNPDERIFAQAGEELATPLVSVVGTSNEPLTSKKVWDRFAIRRVVHRIQDSDEWIRVVAGHAKAKAVAPLESGELAKAVDEVAKVEVSRVQR